MVEVFWGIILGMILFGTDAGMYLLFGITAILDILATAVAKGVLFVIKESK